MNAIDLVREIQDVKFERDQLIRERNAALQHVAESAEVHAGDALRIHKAEASLLALQAEREKWNQERATLLGEIDFLKRLGQRKDDDVRLYQELSLAQHTQLHATRKRLAEIQGRLRLNCVADEQREICCGN